ncbi:MULTISPECIES: YbaN family protein [Thermus]|uniref:YbaN family protein n=1 Tax=Thermus TaxID=270 RepID=UPI001F3529DF|nr:MULTISPECIES: YbaN family protein [Thermus]
MRLVYLLLGLLFTGLGFLGTVLPVLPATPLFLVAVYLFSRSHPGLERWLLSLPRIGPLLQNYREGRGIPLRTKRLASGLALAAALFGTLSLPHPWVRILVLLLIAYGIYFLWWRIPTLAPQEDPKHQ